MCRWPVFCVKTTSQGSVNDGITSITARDARLAVCEAKAIPSARATRLIQGRQDLRLKPSP